MKSKLFIVLYLIFVGAWLAVISSFIILSVLDKDEPSQEPTVGDSPKYVAFSSCPPDAQDVITANGIPKNKVHSCKAESRYVESERVVLVWVLYGDPMDCPSGCIYKSFWGVVDANNVITELPGSPQSVLSEIWAQEPFNTWRNDPNFSPDAEIMDVTEIHVAKRNGQIGYEVRFIRPYNTYGGTVFVWLSRDASGNPVSKWDMSELIPNAG